MKLSSTLILKGTIDDVYNTRIFRVYNGHYVYYQEYPSEGGTVRESRVLNKEYITTVLEEYLENGDITEQQKQDFLNDGE